MTKKKNKRMESFPFAQWRQHGKSSACLQRGHSVPCLWCLQITRKKRRVPSRSKVKLSYAPSSTQKFCTRALTLPLQVFSIADDQDAEQGKNEYVCLREFRAGRVQNSVHAFGCCLFDKLPPEFALHVNGPSPYMAIAMPFVDGTTLLEYLTSHVTCVASPLPTSECINIVSSVIAFIASGYTNCGAVHGDLKVKSHPHFFFYFVQR
jgi:serine/threonine protein kinase